MPRSTRPYSIKATFLLCAAILGLGSGADRAADASESIPLPARTGAVVEKGALLIASESMQDPRFRQSVILLVSHSPRGGTLGFVINQPTEHQLSTESLGAPQESAEEAVVYYGGPVELNQLALLFECESPGAARSVKPGLCVAVSRSEIGDALARREGDARMRVYAGYAGWSPGQLAAEIVRGGWRVSPFAPGVVFSDTPESLWRDLKPPSTPRGSIVVDGRDPNAPTPAYGSAG